MKQKKLTKTLIQKYFSVVRVGPCNIFLIHSCSMETVATPPSDSYNFYLIGRGSRHKFKIRLVYIQNS